MPSSNSLRVLIVGCGYVGRALGAELVRQGCRVSGLRRAQHADAELRDLGIQPIIADLTRPASLPPLGSGYDWVVLCVSASGGGPAEYREVYFEGTRRLLSWLASAPPRKLVYTSSTAVYGQLDGSEVNESSPASPQTDTGRVLLETEQVLLQAASEQNTVVLRVAGIYGPGRSYWLDQVRAGTARIDERGERFLNMIHQADLVGAIHASLVRGKPGEIYNAVDHEPVPQRTLLDWLAGQLGLPVPQSASPGQHELSKRRLTSKRVSNRKLTHDLDYRFRFPTFREGYAELFGAERSG